MKAVFALTSQGRDFFSAMTRVAVASLRLSNPDLWIVVACDSESDDAVRRSNDPLIEEVDEWLVVDTPAGEDGFRNRYVKTGLRALLSGPFVFLDSDVFVRGDLRAIFALDCDIAGARNHSRPNFGGQVWNKDRETLEAMGWEPGVQAYLNGGVLFSNDTPGARVFWEEWRRRWLLSFDRFHCYRDQPALNSALQAVHLTLSVLPNRYNAQIRMEPACAMGAVVWHYYSSMKSPAVTAFDVLVKDIMHGEVLDMCMIRKMVARSHPWRRDYWWDDLIVSRLAVRQPLDGWSLDWLTGKRRHALNRLLKEWLSKRGS